MDASFSVHPDYKSQTGATSISFGVGVAWQRRGTICFLKTEAGWKRKTAQKLNLLELATYHDPIDEVVLGKARGPHKIDRNILHQDNKSAILLEENSKRAPVREPKHWWTFVISFYNGSSQERKFNYRTLPVWWVIFAGSHSKAKSSACLPWYNPQRCWIIWDWIR